MIELMLMTRRQEESILRVCAQFSPVLEARKVKRKIRERETATAIKVQHSEMSALGCTVFAKGGQADLDFVIRA